ncbi:YhjD/YihY/BrkB family envelope integrity protein [Escherichia sp. E3659]|uniref:YhjD/YihY/BrkB family envelope integrity protein n=1 Tax=Escherichia sp. E3659 TaxID=2044462 RepID=UPI003211E453
MCVILFSLIGLLIALIVTLSITSVAGSAQQMIISALHLNSIEWLKPTWRLIGMAISIFANYLLFFWIFWRLPRHRPRKKALIRGTFIAAIGFEVIKIVMTYTLPSLMKSPSGAAFGSVLGLMAFFLLLCPSDVVLRGVDCHRRIQRRPANAGENAALK